MIKFLAQLTVYGVVTWFILEDIATRRPECICEEMPENYFIVETNEVETCESEGKTIVTRSVRQAKVER
tara:strand:+ start:155 stop:361 length:207 start_codon:yes stop_codon:yes gene_type:complete